MKIFPLVLFACLPASAEPVVWFSGPQEIEATGEALVADDIRVQGYRLTYSGTRSPWSFKVGLGWNDYRIDYVPVLFGANRQLDEETPQADVTLTREWNKEWSSILRLRAYDGFSDYRSIWISEFYRQFFGEFSGYRDPDPNGYSVGVSTVWNYLPGTGKLDLALDAGRDEIAPGWSFNPASGQPEADRETLDTLTSTLRVEHALTGWLKSEVALTVRKVTDREQRFGIRNTWAAAAGPVTFRAGGGYTEESPGFDAGFGTCLVEWNFIPHCFAHVGYRVYADSGEIETAGFNAQAPALDSSEIFAGLRWDRGDLSLSGGVGFLETDYEALSEDNAFFGNLYRDREWWTARLAASFRF